MGYLGGVNCALFCAYATMLYPKASAAVILHKCFKLFAEWDWPKPVVLTDVMMKPELGQDENVWNPEKNEKCRSDLFPILTPCYPSQNSCYTVMKSTRTIMINEFTRARDITADILAGKAVSDLPSYYSRIGLNSSKIFLFLPSTSFTSKWRCALQQRNISTSGMDMWRVVFVTLSLSSRVEVL